MNLKKIIVALDNNDLKKTIKIVKELKEHTFAFKVGYEFFYNFGLDGYKLIKNENVKIFLDLKLHDIPNTVYETILGFRDCPIEMLTIHLSGGKHMIHKAIEAAHHINTKVIGVSVLTSLEDNDTKALFQNTVADQTARLFQLAADTEIDGIVCSPLELSLAHQYLAPEVLKITPGIRDTASDDDQARTMTARAAIKNGASYLVIGRPITQAPVIEIALQETINSLHE